MAEGAGRARSGSRSKTDRLADHDAIERLADELLPALMAKLGASGLGEMDVIDVSTCGSLSLHSLDGRQGNKQKQHEKQRASAFHSSLLDFRCWIYLVRVRGRGAGHLVVERHQSERYRVP